MIPNMDERDRFIVAAWGEFEELLNKSQVCKQSIELLKVAFYLGASTVTICLNGTVAATQKELKNGVDIEGLALIGEQLMASIILIENETTDFIYDKTEWEP